MENTCLSDSAEAQTKAQTGTEHKKNRGGVDPARQDLRRRLT